MVLPGSPAGDDQRVPLIAAGPHEPAAADAAAGIRRRLPGREEGECSQVTPRSVATGQQRSSRHTATLLALSACGAAVAATAAVGLLGGSTVSEPGGFGAPVRSVLEESEGSKALVVDTPGGGVELGLVGGDCLMTKGIFSDVKMNRHAEKLGLWSASEKHLVCFGKNDKPHIIAQPQGALDDEGQYGFGPDVKVGLRPDLATSALWHLEASVGSLSVDIDPRTTFRTIALQTSEGDSVSEMPLVIAESPRLGWLVDVQLMRQADGECEPRSAPAGKPWFACRVTPELIDSSMQVIAWCPMCVKYNLKLQVEGLTQKSLEAPIVADSKPWLGWTVLKVAEAEPEEFKITIDAEPGSEARFDLPMSFRVVVVAGGSSFAREGIYADHGLVLAWGTGLSMVAKVTGVIGLVAAIASIVLLPGPVAAQLPSASSAIVSLQFFALFAATRVDVQLMDLAKPMAWMLPDNPFHVLLGLLGVLVVVMGIHAVVVFLYIAMNGKGSATEMPYPLAFGAWELRVISLLALPAAACASMLSARAWFGFDPREPDLPCQQSAMIAALWGSIPVILLSIGAQVFRTIRSLFNDENVVAVPTKNGQLVFVDRVCEQLRAVPVAPGPMACCGSWSASLGWSCSPSVCTIDEVTHHGSQSYGSAGTWQRVWEDGPWDRRQVGKVGTQLVPSRSSSFMCGGGTVIQKDEEVLARSYVSSLSPVSTSMSVAAKPIFTYRSNDSNALAGTASLPWVDVAIPASALRFLVAGATLSNKPVAGDSAESEVKLDVNVAQLSGKYTCGRLSACFEWTDRNPLRWPVDLMLKVLLGIYVGLLPHTYGALGLLPLLLHVGVILAGLGVALAALVLRPYTERVDNFALAAAAAAVSATTASSKYLAFVSSAQVMSGCVILLVVFLAIPICIFLAASCLLVWWSFAFPLRGSTPEAVSLAIDKWGSVPTSVRNGTSATPCTVAPIQEMSITPLFSKINLPAALHGSASYLQIALPAPPVGVRAIPVPSTDTENLRLPLPVFLLLGCAGLSTYEIKSAVPLGAIITSDKARLLYSDKDANGGVDWREVVMQIFSQGSTEVAKGAIRAIEENLRSNTGYDMAIVTVTGGL